MITGGGGGGGGGEEETSHNLYLKPSERSSMFLASLSGHLACTDKY